MARPFREILASHSCRAGRVDRVCDVGVEQREERQPGGPANFVFDLLSKNMSCAAAAVEQRVNERRDSSEEEIELFATTAEAAIFLPRPAACWGKLTAWLTRVIRGI